MMDEDWLEELMLPCGEVRVRRLFGGQGVYLDGLMVALVADGILYLKVDTETAPEFEAAGLDPFAFSAKNGRRTVMSYRKAPGDVLENPDALAPWIGLAYGAAKRAAAAKEKPAREKPAKEKPAKARTRRKTAG